MRLNIRKSLPALKKVEVLRSARYAKSFRTEKNERKLGHRKHDAYQVKERGREGREGTSEFFSKPGVDTDKPISHSLAPKT